MATSTSVTREIQPADRSRSVRGAAGAGLARLAQGRERGLDAARHRHEQRGQGPDRAHADHAGADEAHLRRPDAGGVLRQRLAGRQVAHGGQHRHGDAPGDHQTGQHGRRPRCRSGSRRPAAPAKSPWAGGTPPRPARTSRSRSRPAPAGRWRRSSPPRRPRRRPRYRPCRWRRAWPPCPAPRRPALPERARRCPPGESRPRPSGSSLCTTMTWRSGIENITPSMPPAAQMPRVCQNGKPCQ